MLRAIILILSLTAGVAALFAQDEQTAPQMPGPLTGDAHMLPPVQALPEPHRQTGTVPLASHATRCWRSTRSSVLP